MSNAGFQQTAEVRARLGQIADQQARYGDRLRPDVRRRIVASALSEATSQKAATAWAFIPKLAAAAAMAVILVLPAFKTFRTQGVGPQEAKSPIRDFQVTARNGEVVLTWEDGDQPRRVVKATTREELAHLSEAPGEVVRGERWVDKRPDQAQLVYYFVE